MEMELGHGPDLNEENLPNRHKIELGFDLISCKSATLVARAVHSAPQVVTVHIFPR